MLKKAKRMLDVIRVRIQRGGREHGGSPKRWSTWNDASRAGRRLSPC